MHAPFCADQVGSLLRPEPLKAAHAAYPDGQLDGSGLRAVLGLVTSKFGELESENLLCERINVRLKSDPQCYL